MPRARLCLGYSHRISSGPWHQRRERSKVHNQRAERRGKGRSWMKPEGVRYPVALMRSARVSRAPQMHLTLVQGLIVQIAPYDFRRWIRTTRSS
ncbi:hypothetical protein GCM10027296_38760 [Chitinimonas naiadis]